MIKTKVALNYDGVLELGYLAENDARCFVFDISEWQDCFEAGGSVTLLARRPWDDDCYPCVIETDGAEVRWTIKCSDVAVPGAGRIVLQYKVGDTVVRSKPFSTHISLGIGGDLSKVPPAQQPWVQEVLNAKTSAEKAAEKAEEAAESVKAEVFIAKYDRTTWEELKAAYDAGKHIEVNYGSKQYGLYAANSTQMEFRQPGTANTPYCRCTNAGEWDYGDHPITPEDINAMPGYQGLITGGDLDDYTSPGTYKIEKEHNNEVAHAPFVGEVGTFLQVIPFRENPLGNETDFRVLQEAITNKHGGALDRKWRVKSREVNGVMWSEWQDSSEVYIATYDKSINGSQYRIQEMWDILTWMFGKSDDGQLLGHKTIFCRYPIWDAEKSQYEYHMIPLSKITPNYVSFRGMTSDSTMRIVYFYNTSVSDSTKWGWSTKTQSMVTTTTLNSKISALEKRIAALEGGDVT